MTERSVPRIWRGKRALSDEYVAVDDGGGLSSAVRLLLDSVSWMEP